VAAARLVTARVLGVRAGPGWDTASREPRERRERAEACSHTYPPVSAADGGSTHGGGRRPSHRGHLGCACAPAEAGLRAVTRDGARDRPRPRPRPRPRRVSVPRVCAPALCAESGARGPAGQREKHKELHGTVCIYSPYLNRIKTIQEGRRIPVAAAVEDPTAWEILEVPLPRAEPETRSACSAHPRCGQRCPPRRCSVQHAAAAAGTPCA